ncbi:MAG: Mrp/NBP35 family ATP-binding protein [SAR324 cluster bacterium]|nr:Mrp/NBP35 family ATP-binding protein [SAR324 cluster bacterium]
MASLEEQFEQAFTEIPFDASGKHLLDAEVVTDCVVSGEMVTITLDLPPDEGLRKTITDQVKNRIGAIPGIEKVNIRMAGQTGNGGQGAAPTGAAAPAHAHPPDAAAPAHAHPRDAAAPQRPQKKVYLQEYDTVIAVASGKGGVGKSTVSVNLALTLVQMGHKVSLFDSDIYGPSIPIMMGLRTAQPKMEGNTILPLQKYGLDVMSIGFLVEEAAATIWRGPIVHQVIDQMLRDTRWPGGDFMIIDLPPGTGDAQLTLSQLLEITGAVIVSTPQDVALLDAIKGVVMFQKVDVPVVGLVENMSAFVCPKCGEETPIFDKGNAQRAAGQHNIPFLGGIPIELAIREGGDSGAPLVIGKAETLGKAAFKTIAEALIEELEKL